MYYGLLFHNQIREELPTIQELSHRVRAKRRAATQEVSTGLGCATHFCTYCFTKLSRITLPGTVLTAWISLPLRRITRFRCAFGVVMKVPVQSEFTV